MHVCNSSERHISYNPKSYLRNFSTKAISIQAKLGLFTPVPVSVTRCILPCPHSFHLCKRQTTKLPSSFLQVLALGEGCTHESFILRIVEPSASKDLKLGLRLPECDVRARDRMGQIRQEAGHIRAIHTKIRRHEFQGCVIRLCMARVW